MGALFSFISNIVVSVVMKLFAKNRDEEIGALKEANQDQGKVIADAKKANSISNAVDGMSDDERKQLSNDLDKRN